MPKVSFIPTGRPDGGVFTADLVDGQGEYLQNLGTVSRTAGGWVANTRGRSGFGPYRTREQAADHLLVLWQLHREV